MKIGVVGGGPAGGYASYLLAQKGVEVLLFDHKVPWEKPCGGGITWKALKRYRFLLDAELNPFIVSELEFISPKGREQTISLDNPIYIFSRKKLGAYLLKITQKAGARHLRERVRKIEGCSDGWQISTDDNVYKTDFLIGADGASSIVRKSLGRKLSKSNMTVALSALVREDLGQKIIIKFVKGLIGYIWIFPHQGECSIGICSDIAGFHHQKLQRILMQFLMDKCNYSNKRIKLKSTLLPVVSDRGIGSKNVAGEKWAFIGDAAGFADPLTGEGIYFALRSAQLLVDSLKEDSLLGYPKLLEADFFPQLIKSAHIKHKFFTPAFLERMLFLLRCSPSVREVIPKVIDGEVGYLELKKKLLRISPKAAGEIIITALSRIFSSS